MRSIERQHDDNEDDDGDVENALIHVSVFLSGLSRPRRQVNVSYRKVSGER